MEADQDTVIKAIKLVNEVLCENEIPKLEGGIALRAILNVLADEGMDIGSDKNIEFQFEYEQ